MKVIILDEVEEFIISLDLKSESRIRKYIVLLQEYGYLLRMPYSKNILPGIFELRIIGERNFRVIYTFTSDFAVVFHIFQKKTQKISHNEIDIIKQKYQRLHL